MGSRLHNLIKVLTWNDFGSPKHNVPQPQPGQTAFAAQMSVIVPAFPMATQPIPGSSPPEYRIRDNIQVYVRINTQETYRAAWITQLMTQAQRDLLLIHEQHHYDIGALIARDMFLDLMDVKGRTYSTQHAALNAAVTTRDYYLPYINSLQSRYDEETNHGQNLIKQNQWNGWFSRAFIAPRFPQRQSPVDNATFKLRLTDVLRDAGVAGIGAAWNIP